MYRRITLVSLAIAVLLCPRGVASGEPDGPNGQSAVDSTFVQPQRVSFLLNMAVKNAQGKAIGSINDIVLDPTKGEIRYVAVSFGGFLGLGGKLFAVPWDALEFSLDRDGYHYFLFDVTEEAMQAAPGFDQNTWPDFADEKWDVDVQTFYRDKLRRVPHTEVPNRQ
ncbi:MAG TPA: PRC-barrel domain-containing protein [Pirellulaceae bacterium]